VHANASLFKANEIKRAVQGNQAQAGEILLVNFENEDPMFGIGVPISGHRLRRCDEAGQGIEKTLEDRLQAGHQAAVYGRPGRRRVSSPTGR
jgi:hypothetical protein